MSKREKRYFKAEYKSGEKLAVKVKGLSAEELIGVAAAALAEVSERLDLCTEPGSRIRVLSLLDFICVEGRMPTDLEFRDGTPIENLLDFIRSIMPKDKEDNDGEET